MGGSKCLQAHEPRNISLLPLCELLVYDHPQDLNRIVRGQPHRHLLNLPIARLKIRSLLHEGKRRLPIPEFRLNLSRRNQDANILAVFTFKERLQLRICLGQMSPSVKFVSACDRLKYHIGACLGLLYTAAIVHHGEPK